MSEVTELQGEKKPEKLYKPIKIGYFGQYVILEQI